MRHSAAFYTTGELKAEGSSITEGIGQGRITKDLEGFVPDFSSQIPDAEAFESAFNLVWEEGMCLGGSSGVNIADAIRLAKKLGRDKTIVTMLCDLGMRTRDHSPLSKRRIRHGYGMPTKDQHFGLPGR